MATLQRNLALKVDWHNPVDPTLKRHTKIICTIGPKTMTVPMLEKLLDAGMNVARLNFSHGTHEYHGNVIANIRQALANKPSYHCAIMLDTKGPEIRTGKLAPGIESVPIEQGKEYKVTTDLKAFTTLDTIMLDYQDLATSVQPGYKILVADGIIHFTVKAIHPDKTLTVVAENNNVLTSNKNVHLPGAVVTLPAISEKDREDLLFGIEQKVDSIAASFIRSPQDIKQIRAILGEPGKHIKIIAKIESTEGLESFDEILKEADGIMVARGDLGVELPMQQIFIAQKMMISKCNASMKPVITATQMLESMILNPRPTRAEATDVANAVLDGTDCVMLSGETASGQYPIEAVQYMDLICKEAEKVEASSDYPTLFEALKKYSLGSGYRQIPEVVASYAVRSANDLNADSIITITETGTTSRLICKYRPRVPVICITNSPSTAKYLLFSRGSHAYLVSSVRGTDLLIKNAFERAKAEGLLKSGSLVVVVSGVVEEQSGATNMMKVLTVP